MGRALFTGIVEAVGRVAGLAPQPAGGRRLWVDGPWDARECRPGDSVAVDGVCLTVEQVEGRRLAFSLSPETLRRTTLGQLEPGRPVNLERALTPTRPLGGHIVLGHVDGVAEVTWVRPAGPGKEVGFAVSNDLLPFLALKGSVAIDGVSLTVAGLEDRGFWVALVPHTLQQTNLGRLQPGSPVNLEVDVLARYVARQLAALLPGLRREGPPPGLTLDLLQEHGFTAARQQGGR